jgi:hypothetical protein
MDPGRVQEQAFRTVLRLLVALGAHTMHNGGAKGWDARAAEHWWRVAGDGIVLHPVGERRRRVCIEALTKAANAGVVLPVLEVTPANLLQRSHDMVDAADLLLACPGGPEDLTTPEWATIRYAKRTGKAVVIVYPQGQLEVHGLVITKMRPPPFEWLMEE